VALALYLVVEPLEVQGVTLHPEDYCTYDPVAQVLAPYLDGDAVNPAAVSLPAALLAVMVSTGCLRPHPAPAAFVPGPDRPWGDR